MVGELNINTTGLAALYHINGNYNDALGAYNAGATGTVAAVAGKFGSGAADLGGGYVVSAGVSLVNDFTIGIWIKPDTLPTAGNVYNLMSKQDGSDRQYQLSIYNDGGNQQIFFGNSVLAGGTTRANSPHIAIGKWIFMCGTKSSLTSGTIVGYVNGDLTCQSTSAGNNGTSATNTFLGAGGNTGSNPFDGRIDEAFLINRCWSYREVKNYYAWATGKGTRFI